LDAALGSAGSWSHEDDVVIREGAGVLVGGIGGHEEAAARRIEEAPHGHETILRAARDQRHGRLPAEGQGRVRATQPFDALALGLEEDGEGIVDAEQGRDADQRVRGQGYVMVLARGLDPGEVGGAGGQAEDQQALRLTQRPEFGDGQEAA